MSKSENMQSILNEEVLKLEELFIDFVKSQGEDYIESYFFSSFRFEKTFEKIFGRTIRELKDANVLDKEIQAAFIVKLLEFIKLEFIKWEYIQETEELKKFTFKLADIIVKYGGLRTICTRIANQSCAEFWFKYVELHGEEDDKPLQFMKKINSEINKIVKSNDTSEHKDLLQKCGAILKLFCSMNFEEEREKRDELEETTIKLIDLCIKYEYKLDCTSSSRVPLTYIFGMLVKKSTKTLIIKYLMEFADYFHKLEMDSRECVINVVYPNEDKKSEVFKMYLENALLLGRNDLYSGEIFDKVLTKLFREFGAERYGEIYVFGEDSPRDFSNALSVIGEICNNPNWLDLLSKTDFFDKICAMFNYFITEYYKKDNTDSFNMSLNKEETKMRLRFFRLRLIIKHHQQQLIFNNKKFQGKYRINKR